MHEGFGHRIDFVVVPLIKDSCGHAVGQNFSAEPYERRPRRLRYLTTRQLLPTRSASPRQ
jgi:hypothetical protein